MKLYKYLKCNKNTLDSLLNAYCWSSNPTTFNDPFDCALIRNSFLRQKISEQHKISCFANDYKNLLMWSHYTDSHKGFCIEYTPFTTDELLRFQTAKMLPQVPHENLTLIQNSRPVQYKTEIELNNYLLSFPCDNKKLIEQFHEHQKNGTEDHYLSLFTEGLFLKHKDWAYENEYRLVHTGNNRIMQPGLISQIFFGAKMSSSDKRTIAILIKERYKEKCKINCMHISEDQYGLSVRDFDPAIDLTGLGLNFYKKI